MGASQGYIGIAWSFQQRVCFSQNICHSDVSLHSVCIQFYAIQELKSRATRADNPIFCGVYPSSQVLACWVVTLGCFWTPDVWVGFQLAFAWQAYVPQNDGWFFFAFQQFVKL